MHELSHIYLSYIESEIINSRSQYIMAIGPFLDSDSVLEHLRGTRSIFRGKPADDDTGLHGEADNLSEHFSGVPNFEDFKRIDKHHTLDLIIHPFIIEKRDELREKLSDCIVTPKNHEPTDDEIHMAFEKSLEREVLSKNPNLRWVLTRAYLFMIPQIGQAGKILSDYYKIQGYDISAQTFSTGIGCSIGWGLSRMMTLNYLKGFPRFEIGNSQHTLIDDIADLTMEYIPQSSVALGMMVAENGPTKFVNNDFKASVYLKEIIKNRRLERLAKY